MTVAAAVGIDWFADHFWIAVTAIALVLIMAVRGLRRPRCPQGAGIRKRTQPSTGKRYGQTDQEETTLRSNVSALRDELLAFLDEFGPQPSQAADRAAHAGVVSRSPQAVPRGVDRRAAAEWQRRFQSEYKARFNAKAMDLLCALKAEGFYDAQLEAALFAREKTDQSVRVIIDRLFHVANKIAVARHMVTLDSYAS